jgi:DNA topoisomerase I
MAAQPSFSLPRTRLALQADPTLAADHAGLRYVPDSAPGIARKRRGAGFTYLSPRGLVVHEPTVLARIRALAIPPAWTNVWISIDPKSHLQATGRDAKGRKQYRYHPRWRETRDATKFHRMLAFAAALPRIRDGVEADIARPGLPREKILATAVQLLERTFIRIGHEEYTRKNHSFGLTTLRDRHVKLEGARIHFHFRGKSGVMRAVELHDPRLARILRKCQELPGHELFHYVREDGQTALIDSGMVNDYLRAISGGDFTAKDFRTWAGTVLAALTLSELLPCRSAGQAKKNVVLAIRRVSERLGNTPSVCRKSYVHPDVVGGYLDGHLARLLERSPRARSTRADVRAVEALVVALLGERRRRPANGRGVFHATS